MSQQIINISTPDDGLGDVLRNGFDKTNQNFTELYNGKVDKVTGKGLSENDFTDADKTKLDGIEAGAEVNVQADWGETDPLADNFILNKPPSLYSAFGYFHYSDLATQTTPLALVTSTPLQLINDTLGAFTNEDQAPYGISGVWDTSTNALDFSQLSVGDGVLIRTDLSISTTSVNQTLRLYIKFGVGTASEYDLLIDSWNEKSVVTFGEFIKDVSFSIDNEDWRDAPAKIYVLSDKDGSVKVNGWYIPIIRKSLNVIDFNNDSTKLDKVSTAGVERAYIINADGSQGTKNTSEFNTSAIMSNEDLSNANRKDDVLYGILDQYTGEELTLSKTTGTPTVDGIIYFQLGGEYFKRNYLDFKDARWFGVVGDGVVNDTANLQQAIDSGGKLFIPKGNYKTTATLNVNSNIKINGIKEDTIIFKNGNYNAITINSRCTIDGLAIDGGNFSGNGIFLGIGCNLKNIGITKNLGYGIKFSEINHIITQRISDCTIAYNIQGGIFISSSGSYQCNDVSIDDTYIVKNGFDADTLTSDGTPTSGHGIYINGGLSIRIKNCVTEYNTGAGVYLDKATGYTLRGLSIVGNYFEQNKYAELLIDYNGALWQNSEVVSSTFSSVITYPANSLVPTHGTIAYITRNSLPVGVRIEDNSYNFQKLKFSFEKISLKPNESFDYDYASYKNRIDNTSAESEGFNCLRIDQSSGNFSESYRELFTKINSGYSVLITLEYKCFLDGIGNGNFKLRRKDKNGNQISGGGIDFTVTLFQSLVWKKVTFLYDKSNLTNLTKYLEFAASIDNGITANSYLLIKNIKISQTEPLAILNGTTTERPSPVVGEMFFDTTINRPIFGGNSGWIEPFALLNNPNFTGTVGIPNLKILGTNEIPATATSTGVAGEVRFTTDYIYFCVSTNVWKRTPLTTW